MNEWKGSSTCIAGRKGKVLLSQPPAASRLTHATIYPPQPPTHNRGVGTGEGNARSSCAPPRRTQQAGQACQRRVNPFKGMRACSRVWQRARAWCVCAGASLHGTSKVSVFACVARQGGGGRQCAWQTPPRGATAFTPLLHTMHKGKWATAPFGRSEVLPTTRTRPARSGPNRVCVGGAPRKEGREEGKGGGACGA